MTPSEETEYEALAVSSRPAELSVLMPVFRQEAFVGEAIASVLRQDDIVLDVIISDDASGDQTVERALSAVQGSSAHPHAVRFRRGLERLGRAHIHHLVKAADARVVAQAHGDDVALPGRFRRIADLVAAQNAVFVSSGFTLIDAEGATTEEWVGQGFERPVTLAEAIERPPWTMGAMEAWVPAEFGPFAALELDYAPMSHDRILAVRGAILGRAWLIDEPLIQRRTHATAWNRRLVDSGSPEAKRHGWALVALMWAGVVLDDLREAQKSKLVDPLTIDIELKRVRKVRDTALRELRRHHGRQLARGKRLKWVGDS